MFDEFLSSLIRLKQKWKKQMMEYEWKHETSTRTFDLPRPENKLDPFAVHRSHSPRRRFDEGPGRVAAVVAELAGQFSVESYSPAVEAVSRIPAHWNTHWRIVNGIRAREKVVRGNLRECKTGIGQNGQGRA